MGSESDAVERDKEPPAIIIDECLSYIINHINVADVETLIKLCVDTFEENEIEASKDLLFNILHDVSTGTELKKRRNRGKFDDKSVRNVRDIYQLLQEKGDVIMPKFVAYDLSKLPPIGFNHMDVTVLFSKIQSGNAAISTLKDSISILNDSNNSLCEMINDLNARMKKLEISGSSDKSKENPTKSGKYKETDIRDCEKLIDDLLEKMPFECTKCDLRYKTDSELRDHIIIHSSKDEIVHKCPTCDYTTDSDISLSSHMLSHESFKCSVNDCSFESTSEETVNAHIALHIGEITPFKCTKCDLRYKTDSELMDHIIIHGSKDVIIHKCSTCGYIPDSEASWSTHVLSHESYKCCVKDCDFKSTSEETVNAHIELHTGEILSHKSYKCNMKDCDFNSTSEETFNAHLELHTSKLFSLKSYKCNVKKCDFKSASEETVKAHTELHIGEKLYNCIVCKSSFDKYEELEVHYLSMHTDEKPFECTKCEFTCKDKTTLECHMQIHTSGNNNKCPFCNSYFVDLKSLQQHIGVHLSNRNEFDLKVPNKPYSDAINAWDNNESAKQHFIDSFLNLDGFSLPVRNGRPVRPKNSNTNKKIPVSPLPINKNKKLTNIGTGDDNSLGIKTRKYKADVFATRYEPSVDTNAVKYDLEKRLLKHTGVKHTVEVEKLQSKYDHYSSFKITCFCEHTAVFMNSNIWPSGILFKWWRGKRNNS